MKRVDLAPQRSNFYSKAAPSKQPVKVEYKTWAGVDWSHSTMRPGCQDFLACPSRRSDGLHPHRAPILNGGTIYA